MPSSTTHNIVRVLQLALSISIVATAAFLLHYRTQAHSNFTNEPLVSCISGAVAFIYASWALLNHRRQPDNRRWIYLHGLCCFVVCGLLIAASTLGFILSKQGVSCERFQEAQDTNPPAVGVNSRRLATRSSYPPYQDGHQYAPGQLCENSYEEMDKSCAVLGVVAAIMWLFDFVLIFGLCGSSGRYGPHREPRYRRRGQIGPDDSDDYYPAGEVRDGAAYSQGAGRLRDFEPQEDYYDTLDQRKRELYWLEHRTRNDPKWHEQGPIPLSMQQNFYGGPISSSGATNEPMEVLNDRHDLSNLQQQPINNFVTAEAPEDAPRIVRPTFNVHHSSADAAHHHHHSTTPLKPTVLALSPPPGPRTKWEQAPDSSTPANQGTKEPGSQPNMLPRLPAGLVTPPALQTIEGPPRAQSQAPETLEAPLQCLAVPEPDDQHISSTLSSPRYVEFPPGPACYVFDSSQQQYLPSFVNMAARIEQKQGLKGSSSGTPLETPVPSSPVSTTGSAGRIKTSQRIVVTGLGFDAISRDEQEIAAEADAGAKGEAPEQESAVSAHSALPALALGSPSISPASGPKKIALPATTQNFSKATGSYFPKSAVPAMGSPTGSLKSFMSSKSGNDQSIGGGPVQQIQGQTGKKPSMTKRKTSKLSVVTLKSIMQNPNGGGNIGSGHGGGSGIGSTSTSQSSGAQEMSPQMPSSPRSPYVGDF